MSKDPAFDQLLAEEGLHTSEAGPAVSGWINDVTSRALDESLAALLPELGASAPWIAAFILGVAAVLAIAILVQLLRLVRAAEPLRGPAIPVPAPLPVAHPTPSRAEVDAHLRRGDALAALAALWRWVSASLEARGYARAAPDRTNRELLAEVRRAAPDWTKLRVFARMTSAIDGHLFGGVAVDAQAVQALLPLAEEVAQG